MNLPITLKSIVVQVQIGDTVYPLTLDAAPAAIKVPAFTGTTGTVSVANVVQADGLGSIRSREAVERAFARYNEAQIRKHYTHGLPSWYMEDCMKPKTFGQLAKAKKKKARKK